MKVNATNHQQHNIDSHWIYLIIFSLLFKFSKPGFDLEIWITAMITMKIIMAIITMMMMMMMMMMIVTMMIIAILTFIIHGDQICRQLTTFPTFSPFLLSSASMAAILSATLESNICTNRVWQKSNSPSAVPSAGYKKHCYRYNRPKG